MFDAKFSSEKARGAGLGAPSHGDSVDVTAVEMEARQQHSVPQNVLRQAMLGAIVRVDSDALAPTREWSREALGRGSNSWPAAAVGTKEEIEREG